MLMTKYGTELPCTSKLWTRNRWLRFTSKKVSIGCTVLRNETKARFHKESTFSLAALESKLVAYVNDTSAAEAPFDASDIPKISREQAAKEAARKTDYDDLV
jgi:hypothetical protein